MNASGVGAVDLKPTTVAAFTVRQCDNAVLVSGAATGGDIALIGLLNFDIAAV